MIHLLFIVYRRILSADTGLVRFWFPFGCCRFYPSCSQYAEKLIEARGLFCALPRIAWRLLRCNPYSAGGIDPLKNLKSKAPNPKKIQMFEIQNIEVCDFEY